MRERIDQAGPERIDTFRPLSPVAAIQLAARGKNFEKLPGTQGNWTAHRTKGVSDIAANVRNGAVKSSAKERPNKAVGGPVVGTKKEEKQNFRVRFLHTAPRN
ncbi:hypothetical protein EOA33_24490 [Mesorhizobium sp. M4A.F.Ca.ET.050.02.1.1]|uniref:hypothetical protein n=1 Tax=Mesorhizobium sp. M4A.F.Ca.ET.050.02.1.1 TaxID=2496754 RepID=UPI000FC9DE66|nr:hypothetical protein [Mesorhizobium sp. M4A.F.Ca.ET.050.02.1.1]RUX45286.1 hypothetical protein EOA33_24490 [Mesorhizobium sp. M4A.F.Ca.ET.050.02.1.1]